MKGKLWLFFVMVPLVGVVLQFKYVLFGRAISFGYPINVYWDILIAFFWGLWVLGIFGLFLDKAWSLILFIPTSLWSILALLFDFNNIFHKSHADQFFYFGGLILVFVTLFRLKIFLSKKKPSLKYYLFSFIMFLVLTGLFMTIPKRLTP